ncbi:peptide ABC transporter substrate-binding protein [Mammaliicoccus sp. Dog046]|uniref:peptide ABC transporter substrate-binding protein n=1 Tax=Mammaliicoccus sp. Dog046 TaxID=3034233 RepID=UPI002B25D376|nr:peptide ABC transporter substrate-binding protein [Mammaliicoccus sp. Dog046]WQK84838.1 peptide ABC transporter substrate-binding protein [Mammaliicoccus sp. Dog046]
MNKNFFVFIAVIASMVLILSACSGGNKKSNEDNIKKTKEKNELNLSSGDDIPTMDSSLASDQVSFTTFTQTLEGLYVLDKDDKPVPGVAKGKPEKSSDGKTWTIKLRDNAKWSNGDPVTANDFVFAWRRSVDPDTAAEFSYMFENIQNAKDITAGKKKVEDLGVKAVDDHTLEIKLVKDVPWMESLLAFASYMPQNEKFVKSQGEKYGTTAKSTLSNGPFKLTEWKTEDKWKLERNENYWDKKKVKLDAVNVKIIKDTQTAINMYQTGKLDTVGLDAQNIKKYKGREDFSTEATSGSYFFRINKEKNKNLKNKDLRLAISKSIDKKSYVNSLLNNGSKPLDTLMIKDFVKDSKGNDYTKGVKSPLSYDKKEAKKHLEKAKKALGKDKITIELLTYDEDESKKAGEFVKEQIEKNLPGVTLKIKQQPFKQKLSLEAKKDFDISFAGWFPDYPDPTTFLDLFTSDSPHNQTGYANKEYDKALEKANSDEMLKSDKSDERIKELQNAESQFLESASITPLYQTGAARLRQPYIKNWQNHKYGGDYSLKEVEIAGAK